MTAERNAKEKCEGREFKPGGDRKTMKKKVLGGEVWRLLAPQRRLTKREPRRGGNHWANGDRESQNTLDDGK